MKHSLSLLIFLLLSCNASNSSQNLLNDLKTQIESGDYPNIDAVIIEHKNKVIFEEYFNGFRNIDVHQIRSAHKSITSLFAGIAVDQGLFSIEDEVGKFLTEWTNDPRGKIKIKDMLQMRSGLACEEFFSKGPDCESAMYESEDWLAYLLSVPSRHQPGTTWEYSSMEPDLVGTIIARASGMTLMDFADQYLFGPMGIENFEWEITPDGRGYSAGSSRMLPRDMLKIAQLVRNKGNWQGRQLVSSNWIDESTDCYIPVEMSFLEYSGLEEQKFNSALYGFFWYIERLEHETIDTEVLFASGNGGQYMMLIEDYDLALVFNGSNYGSRLGKMPFEMIVNYIIPFVDSL